VKVSLVELAKAFKILKEAGQGAKGWPIRTTGLRRYLLELKREDKDQHACAEEVFPG